MLKIQKRFLKYTRTGELISKPDPIKWRKLYHPVLGEYDSEYIEASGSEANKKKKDLKVVDYNVAMINKHSRLSSSESNDGSLMSILRNNPSGANLNLVSQFSKLRLGQVVYLRRKIALDKTDTRSLQPIFGLIIQLNIPVSSIKDELNDKDSIGKIVRRDTLEANPFIRVRTIVSNSGVEYKIPLYSPFLYDLHVLKESSLNLDSDEQLLLSCTGGLNLFGVRGSAVTYKRSLVDAELDGSNDSVTPECVEKMMKYIDASYLSDKGRNSLIRQINQALAKGESLEKLK